MSRLFGILKESDGLSEESGSCEFSLEAHFSRGFITNMQVEAWECPYDSAEDANLCQLHLPVGDKSADDVYEFLSDIVEESDVNRRYEFVGTIFPEIDLNKLPSLESDQLSVFDFRNSEIYGPVSCGFRHFTYSLDFSGSQFHDGVLINKCKFTGGFNLSEAIFFNNDSHFIIHDSIFSDEFDVKNAIFVCPMYLNENLFKDWVDYSDSIFSQRVAVQRNTFNRRANFSDCKFLYIDADSDLPDDATFLESVFHDSASFRGSKFRGNATFMDVELTGSFMIHGANIESPISFERADINRFAIHNSELPEALDFKGASVGEIVVEGTNPVDGETLLDFIEAEVRSGNIHQPTDGVVKSDFSGGLVGDINFKPDRSIGLLNIFSHFGILHPDDTNCLNFVRFFKTDFEGFQFSNYYSELRELNWRIHELDGEEIEEVSGTLGFEKSGDDSGIDEYSISGRVMSPESLQMTYALAKKAAREKGAEKISSEFYIQEMKKRKKYHRETAVNGLRNISLNNVLITLDELGRWQINSFLEMATGYGERLWAPVVYSVFIVLNFGLAYPIFGALEGDGSVYSLSSAGTIDAVSTVVQTGIYFSIVTFTTLGYGDLRPVGEITRLLAGIEAFLGSFIMALLIFTLGRKMYR